MITKTYQIIKYSHFFVSSSCSATSTSAVNTSTTQNISQTSTYRNHDIENRSTASDSVKTTQDSGTVTGTSGKLTTYNNDDDESLWSRSMKSSSTYSQLASSAKPRQK